MRDTRSSLFRTWLITLFLALSACTQVLGDFTIAPAPGGPSLDAGGDAGGGDGGPVPNTGPIIVNPTTGLVTSESGRTAQFTIVLKSKPTSSVVVGLQSNNKAEGTASPGSVTFTSNSWNLPQTVTVTGVDDTTKDGNKTYSIITAPASSEDATYKMVNPPDVSVTNVDDESAGFQVNPDKGLVTTEFGGEATFTVALNTPPTSNVTIKLSSSDPVEGKVAPLMMVFTKENYRSPQMATVTGLDDGEKPDGPQAYKIVLAPAVSMDLNYDKVDPDDVEVVNEDNDTAGFAVKPTAGLVTNENGQMATFTMALNYAPSANVVVKMSSSNTSEGIVSPAILTFTPTNWKAPQVVTVSGLDDNVADGDQQYQIMTAPVESADTNYNKLDPPDVGVTNVDNDSPGITVKPAEGLVTTEAGGEATFTIVLNSKPSDNVVVGLKSSLPTEGVVMPAAVTFTKTSWNAPQTVTITGVNDFIADGKQPYVINTLPATSADTGYNGLDGPDVKVSNSDDDSAGFIVTPTMGLVTTEKGDFATFTIALTSKPTANVRIPLVSTNLAEGIASPTLLTFTPDNYRAPQTVTVTGVDDKMEDGNQAYRIATSIADSTDPGYSGLPVPDVDVINNDDDSAGIFVKPTKTPLETTEKADTATFTVVLTSQPAATTTVTIPLSSTDDTEGTVSPKALVFTGDNWNAPRTVTITGVDDDEKDGNQEYRITIGAAVSGDMKYNGIDVPDPVVTNIDNDVAGIKVNAPAMLTTSEKGDSTTFTVELNSKPTMPVRIGLASSMPAEGTVSPASLTFSTTDWNAPQTVTITGVNDNVVDGSQLYAVITQAAVSSDVNYNDLNPADVPVTNIDDDSPGFIIAPATLLVTNEDGVSAAFTVTLQSQPVGDVTVMVHASDATEGRTDVPSLTFTAANYASPHTVTVTGVNDDVADGNQTYRIILDPATSTDPLYNGFNPADVNAVNNDNDTPDITVSAPEGNTREDGTTTTFTVRLASQPAGMATVTIPISSSNPNEGQIMQPSLVFTTANWSAPQTVTVRGVDDSVADGNQQYRAILGAAMSADPNYDGFDATDVVLTNVDNDKAGITVSAAAGSTNEGGGTTTFTVVLDSQPTADVTIPMSSSNVNEGTVMAPSLTFTTVNWAAPQTVTVRGTDDNVADGNQQYRIILGAAMGGDYAGIDPPDVTLTNVDDDSPGFIVTPTTGLTTTENGGTATFTVRLTSEPTANVTVGVHSSDVTEGSTNVATLTFTAANYNSPQTVTVRGMNDDVADGNQSYRVILDPAMSSDGNYNNRDPGDVTVSNTDNDSADITVTAVAGLSTGENGSDATFTVVLNSQPTADVVIPLASNDTSEGTVSPASITFTAANWSAPRTITVHGIDDPVQDGNQLYRVTVGPATSTDTGYAGKSGPDVSLTNTDNDTAGISVTPTTGLTTGENGTTAAFTVTLNSQPTADVSIAISSGTTSEGTVSTATLAFTSANWNAPKTVTLRGVDDAVQDGDKPYTITIGPATSGDGNYNGKFGADVHAINVDNDSAGITVTPTTGLSTAENGLTASFTVVLNSQPTATVTIPIASGDPTEGTVAPTSLIFTDTNWSSPRTVTVRGVDDPVQDGDKPYLVNVGPATSGDTNYNGKTGADVHVLNVDNDSAGITVAPTTSTGNRLATLENGATATFTVVLNSQPTADVTIPLASSNTNEGTVSPASLVFSTTDWSAPKTVTLHGVDDAVQDGDQTYVISVGPATSPDINYAGKPGGQVFAVNVDNDTSGITVAPITGPNNRLTTTEIGGTITFTVVLNSQPTNTVTIPLTSSSAEGAPTVGSIQFTTTDWGAPKTVTVRGADDPVQDGDKPYMVAVGPATSSDTNYAGMSGADIYLTNTDNDTAGITVTPATAQNNRLTTGENGTNATFTVVLNSQPTASVTITLTNPRPDQGTVTPSPLTFTTSDWNGAQTVTIRSVNDAVADGDPQYSISFAVGSSDPNYNNRPVNDVYVTDIDNDVAGITISPATTTMSRLTTNESGTLHPTFTVVLNSQPTQDVSIPLANNVLTEGSFAPGSPLVFTAANWSSPQTVTLTGVDDGPQDGDQPYEITVGPASSGDTNYNNRPSGIVYCTNVDNDQAGIIVTPATSPSSRLQTNEDGTLRPTFTIVLNAQPTTTVSIGLASSMPDEGVACASPTLPPSCTPTVVFTPGDWSTPKTVTLVGVNDAVQDGSQQYVVQLPITTTDPNYGMFTIPDVYATNADDDVRGITVSAISGNTTEGGGSATFTVVLNTQPTSPVTLNVSSSDQTEGTLGSVTSLTFTPGAGGPNGWSTPHTVTVTGVDDDTNDGDVLYHIDLAAASGGDYVGVIPSPNQLTLSNIDNDAPGLTVSSMMCSTTSSVSVPYLVTLTSEPKQGVTVSFSVVNMADLDKGSISPLSVDFTNAKGNWAIPQTVTVSGGMTAGDYPIAATTTSADSDYQGLNWGTTCTNTTP
jgi:hypothetical protein